MKRLIVMTACALGVLALGACAQYNEAEFTEGFVEGFTEEGGTSEEGECAAKKLWNEFDQEELEQIAEDPSANQDDWLPLVVDCMDEDNPDGVVSQIKEETVKELETQGLTSEQATCLTDRMIEEFGLEQLMQIGMEDNPQLTPEQEQTVAQLATECVAPAA